MGQQGEGIKVEVISNEMVKPSLPASCHPQTFTLSRVDQLYPAFHMPLLLFYTATPPQAGHQVDVVPHLKASLSQTLDHFYPVAGRFVDYSTISCTHQGIPFIETKVHSHLSDVLSSSHNLHSLLPEFLPPRQHLQPISKLVPVSLQVNVFLCGGVVIGCYNLHKLFDATSIGAFFKYWSALAANRVDGNNRDLIRPDFEATIKAFPPLGQEDKVAEERVFAPDLYKDTPRSGTTVVKSFKFNMAAITRLKAKAASKAVPAPTRFEALAGFVWEHTMQAAAAAQQHNDKVLSISVNMRPRMTPPLPKQSMGNVITNLRVAVNHETNSSSNLQELVQEIHTGLSHIDHRIKTDYQGEQGVEVLCRERKAQLESLMNCDKHKGYPYQLNSLCYNGFSDADFGFGMPSWVVPIDGILFPPARRDFIMFTDYKHPTIASDSGIEVWFNLQHNHMTLLESSPLFLAFASPNYSS